jgi:hypothetical protein
VIEFHKQDKVYRLPNAKWNVTKRLNDSGKSSFKITTTTENKERNWKRALIVYDDPDITTTFKLGIENSHFEINKKLEFLLIMILEYLC